MIYPHIHYGIITWGSASKTTLNPLITLQKRAIRLITNSAFNSHTNSLFKKLEILKINEIHKLEVCKHMHKVHSKSYPATNPDSYSLVSTIHNHKTRSSSNQALMQFFLFNTQILNLIKTTYIF